MAYENIIPEIRLVNYRKCTPEWKLVENTLEGTNLTYLVQGEALYTADNQTVKVKEGDLLVLPKGCVRKAITFPDRLMHCFSVDFILKNTKNQEISLPFPEYCRAGRHEDIIRLFHELAFAWVDKLPGYILKCNGLLLQILYRFLELIVFKTDIYAGDYRVTKVIHYIAAHYSESITVKGMAEMVDLHPTYFGSLFRKTMGIGFNQYLIHTRIKNAENMLRTGEYKVGNIAEACGFTDTAHLYKQFKLHKGFSPSHCLPKKSGE
ncbi:MAG: AraC family transcriptional regulator [Treponema sp.]|nr:AraC family transcriptional regulator [Treponema sp.]